MPAEAFEVPPHGYADLETALPAPSPSLFSSADSGAGGEIEYPDWGAMTLAERQGWSPRGQWSTGAAFTYCTRPRSCVDGLDQARYDYD